MKKGIEKLMEMAKSLGWNSTILKKKDGYKAFSYNNLDGRLIGKTYAEAKENLEFEAKKIEMKKRGLVPVYGEKDVWETDND
jgi:hypothetical protein